MRVWQSLRWLRRSMVETAQTRVVGVSLVGYLVLTGWGGAIPRGQPGSEFQDALQATALIMTCLGLFGGLLACKKTGKLTLRAWWASARPFLIVAALVLSVFLLNIALRRHAPLIFGHINNTYIWLNSRPPVVLLLFLLVYTCVLVSRSFTIRGWAIHLKGTQVGQGDQAPSDR